MPNIKKINTFRSINWVIQTTIGVKILDVIDVLTYLNKTNHESDNKKSYWSCVVKIGKKIMETFCVEFPEYKYNDISIQKMLNWLVIVVYENCKQNIKFVFEYIKQYNINKFGLTFVSRHEYYEMLPNLDKTLLDNFKIFLSYDEPEKIVEKMESLNESIQQIIMSYNLNIDTTTNISNNFNNCAIFLIIGDIITNAFDNTLRSKAIIYRRNPNNTIEYSEVKTTLKRTINVTKDQGTNIYEIENEILLFEFRSLYKLLDMEQNSLGIAHAENKITLNNLKQLCDQHLE